MEQGIIDNIVSKEALSALETLESSLTRIEKGISDINKNGINLKGGGSANISKDIEAAVQAEQKLTQAREKAIVKTEEEKQRLLLLNQEKRLNAKLTIAEADAIAKLNAEYNLISFQLKNYSTAQLNAIGGVEKLTKRAQELDSALKIHDQTLGRYSRNVGNYAGHTFQLTQVMREIPNFAQDARIGFMSLSNNLPMLADSFAMVKAQIIETEGAAGAGMKAFKVFAKSLLSVNTIMIIAVTLMTLFGDKIVDWVGNLFKGSKAVNEFVSSAKQMSEAIRKGKEDAQNEIQSLKALYSISQDNKRSMDDRMKAVEELQRKYPKYFGNLSDEEILLGKGKIAYNNLTEAMYRNAVTRASLDKITENSKEMLKLDEAITWRKREILRMETAIADIRGNRKENELSQQESDKIDAFNISLVVLRGEMARMKKGYDAFNRSNERLKGNLDISGLIDQNTQSLEGSTESIDDETTAMSLLRNELEKLKESQAGASPTSELGQRGSILGDTLKRLMSTDQIEQYNKFINDESKKQLEYEQEVADKKASIIEKGWNIAKQLGESYFEWYNNKLDDEMEAFNTSNDQRLAELENANRLGLITNEDYQTQKLQLEAEADAKQNEIDKKQRQAKKDAFLLEQGIALAQVWVDYAKAVGATGFNPLLQPWYLGEAIAMSALIAAQTIPAFAEGGTVDKDGNILVGDGGRREAVISPDGRIYITPDVPTVINAKRGSEILPDASILNNRDIMRSLMVDAGYGMNTKALERKFDILTSEVKKLKQSPQKGTRLMDEIQIARNLKLN